MRTFIGMDLCGVMVCLGWPVMNAEVLTLDEILKAPSRLLNCSPM